MRISDSSSDVCSSDLVDEKQKSVVLTEDGTETIERALEAAGLLEGANLYDYENTQVVHHLNQALKANVIFKRDIDYIVKSDKVIIIRSEEHTSELQSLMRISYAVFCLKKKNKKNKKIRK